MQPGLEAERLLNALLDQSVEFVVIGGLAVVFHGYLRVTEDVDVCYARTKSNCSAIANAIAPFHPTLRGAPPGLPFVFDARTIWSGLNFTLATDLGPIDLLGEVTGVGGYPEVAADAVAIEFGGRAVKIMGLTTLKRAKRGAGRVKDLLDLEALDKLT